LRFPLAEEGKTTHKVKTPLEKSAEAVPKNAFCKIGRCAMCIQFVPTILPSVKGFLVGKALAPYQFGLGWSGSANESVA
jgi:hypothetical protein